MAKPVSMVFPKDTMEELFCHELRWSIALKSSRPFGYWGLIFTQGLPWALLGAGVALSMGSVSVAVCYLLVYLLLRLGLTLTTGAWGLRDRRLAKILWLVPVRDAIGFIVWVKGFFSDKVVWRGLKYHLKKGLLIPIPVANQDPATRRETISSVVN